MQISTNIKPIKVKRPILRYHGGKFLLADWIISYFPDHRVYTEVFGGAASVLLKKRRSYAEVYNDLDGEVVNLFRVARDHGDEDAINEGILPLLMSGAQFATHGQLYNNYLERYESRFQDGVYPKLSFKTLWESINGLYSWGKNPFVWVYEFERVEKPEVWP